MIKIRITMHSSLVRGSRVYDTTLPQSWAEVPADKAWKCMEILLSDLPRKKLVKELLSLPASVFARIDTGQMYDLIQAIKWMQVNPESTAPIANYVTVDHTRLYLPGAKFATVSGREYMLLDQLYQKWKESDWTDALIESQMIALLLRPRAEEKHASDARVPLQSQAQTESWMKLIEKLKPSVRLTMLYFISANRKFIFDTYGHWLFQDSSQKDQMHEGEDQEMQEPEDDGGVNFGYMGMFMDIAEDGVFGTYEQVLDTSIHTLFAYQVKKVDAFRREKQRLDHIAAQNRSR